jgi:hypothetical protein
VRRAIGGALQRRKRWSALVDSNGEDGAKWERFADWARSRGVEFEKWHVGDVGGGLRGAIAHENVREGSVLVSAPPSAVLSVRQAEACPLPRSFIDPTYWDRMGNKWEMRMALLLLYEKRLGPSSAWAPYLDVLPQKPQDFGLPLTFSDDEIEQLQFPRFIADVRVEREYWTQQHTALASVMPQPPSRDELFWALSCVCSRTFTCEYGGKLPPAQVPSRSRAPTSHCLNPTPRTLHPTPHTSTWCSASSPTALDGFVYKTVLSLLLHRAVAKGEHAPGQPVDTQTVTPELPHLTPSTSHPQVMFPVADMFNHESRARTSFTFHRDRFLLAAGSGAAKGQQVVISYGPLSSQVRVCVCVCVSCVCQQLKRKGPCPKHTFCRSARVVRLR